MAHSTIAQLGELASERWGLITTAQAEQIGISRRVLSRLASGGALIRVAQGVYRMAGAPEAELEWIYSAWMALGGPLHPVPRGEVPPLVAAGETAAHVHRIGDWFPGVREFIVPSRRGTRLDDVKLRIVKLTPAEVMLVDGLPTLTVERTIADLMAQWTDRSLVVDALRQAFEQGKLVSPRRLAEHLEPIAHAHQFDGGITMATDLMAEAGLETKALARG